jgi:hypothetical protein
MDDMWAEKPSCKEVPAHADPYLVRARCQHCDAYTLDTTNWLSVHREGYYPWLWFCSTGCFLDWFAEFFNLGPAIPTVSFADES